MTIFQIDILIKKQLIVLIALVFSSGIYAQGIYNNGAKIVIGSGTTLFISGNYQNETNVSDGSIDLSGTLKLEGNYTNNVAAVDVISSASAGSKLELIGTVAQTIGGTTSATFSFPDLTINNSAGISITKNAIANGIITFTKGLVDIGNNNLAFGPTASIAGTPSALSMIIATGTGEVRKEYTGVGSFTFPVGDNTSTAEYSPVSLNFTGGTFAPGAYAGVNLVNAAYSDPSISGSYLNRYWNINQTGITDYSCDAVFNYPVADVVGTESDIYGVRIIPVPVFLFNAANTTLHQLTAAGLTSFGTFTGTIGQRILNLTVFIEGLYIGNGTMRQAQGTSGNEFPGTTADQITVELHDPASYANIPFSAGNIDLNTSGNSIVNVPAIYNGSYYLTVKHRNSIETVSVMPISFATNTISYDFTTSASQAFGNKMKDMGGVFAIYSGDVNVDGIVDGTDLASTENSNNAITLGYVPQDVNGDGIVDGSDLAIVENNSNAIVNLVTP